MYLKLSHYPYLLLLIIALLPFWAEAHVDSHQALGFTTGLGHPWSGLDHILAMVAVGIWGAQLGRPAVWLLPVVFPMMMAFGGMLGLLGVPFPSVEAGIAISAIVLGLMVLFEVKGNMQLIVALVGFFALFHGYAHGTELPEGQSGLLYSMGFVVGTGLLHGIGIGLGLLHRFQYGRLGLRAAGSIVMLMGGVFLWQAMA
ncbi:HupE/UreJ family protein [Shewanella sp. A25]|nr:HupE/UreJ family protein [Shewanella shenzhenensis]